MGSVGFDAQDTRFTYAADTDRKDRTGGQMRQFAALACGQIALEFMETGWEYGMANQHGHGMVVCQTVILPENPVLS